MSGDVEVIDLCSDSRPKRSLPRAGPSNKSRKRKAPPSIFMHDVIEISDTEDAAGPSASRAFTITVSASNVVDVDVPPPPTSLLMIRSQEEEPLFLPEPEDFVAGPSNTWKRSRNDATPPPPTRTPTRILEDDLSIKVLPDPSNLASSCLAQVFEIVPDVDPDHVRSLITLHLGDNKQNVLELVLHALFEDENYPKMDRKGKRKREVVQGETASVSRRRLSEVPIDYADETRPQPSGLHYQEMSVTRLSMDFPSIPVQHIRRQFKLHNFLYAPTYIALDAELAAGKPSYKPLTCPRTGAFLRKGKGVERNDPDFDLELEYIQRRRTRPEEVSAVQLHKETGEELEATGIECGCCFAENPFDDMIQCPDAHLFCKTCMTTYASTKLGERDVNIVCMDQSDCKLPFPESELRRLLTPKLLSLYERIKQRKEIEAAGLENLEECPFCEYKVVIENEMEKLFRCENAECGAVSCRACKKVDHLPKTCKEVADDTKLDARHTVEEAMSAALLRNCPKCGKVFLKESGCNKMTCPDCRTLSCYVCRKIITGYDHFNQAPPYTQVVDSQKCPLWDQVEQRHVDEVAAAAKKAMEQVRLANPNVDDSDIHVDLPKAPPAPAVLQGQPPYGIIPLPVHRAVVGQALPQVHHHHHHHHHHQHVQMQAAVTAAAVQNPLGMRLDAGMVGHIAGAHAIDAHMHLHAQPPHPPFLGPAQVQPAVPVPVHHAVPVLADANAQRMAAAYIARAQQQQMHAREMENAMMRQRLVTQEQMREQLLAHARARAQLRAIHMRGLQGVAGPAAAEVPQTRARAKAAADGKKR